MSLEQSIADLQTQAGLLLDLPKEIRDEAITQITAIGNAYENHIDRLVEVFFVSNTGSDSASGLDNQNPLKTIQKAADLTPVGGISHIVLMSDIHVDENINVNGKCINIEAEGSVKFNLSFEHYEIISNGTESSRVHSFTLANGGQISVRDLTIVLPHSDNNFANNRYGTNTGLFKCSPGNVALAGWMSVCIIDCDISRPANSQLTVVGLPTSSCCFLTTRSVIETDQPLAGYWINDIPAGTVPSSTNNIVSTLATL